MTSGVQQRVCYVTTTRDNVYGAVLFSIDVEVPAYTRYAVDLSVRTYASVYCGRSSYSRARAYYAGQDPETAAGTYYSDSNNPNTAEKYKIAAATRSLSNSGTATSDATSRAVWYFDNPTDESKTVKKYFVTIGRGWRTYPSGNTISVQGFVTYNGIDSVQRLVPTSYDVEYDQLRHSLEEEYYEAIRLDENYPTEGVRVTSGYTGGWNGMANCIDCYPPIKSRKIAIISLGGIFN